MTVQKRIFVQRVKADLKMSKNGLTSTLNVPFPSDAEEKDEREAEENHQHDK